MLVSSAHAEVSLKLTWSPDRILYHLPYSYPAYTYVDTLHRYRPEYAKPTGFSGMLDGCSSNVNTLNQPQYNWKIERLEFPGLGRPGVWVVKHVSGWTSACRMMASGSGDLIGTLVEQDTRLTFQPINSSVDIGRRYGHWLAIPGTGETFPTPKPINTLIGPIFEYQGTYRVTLAVRNSGQTQAATTAIQFDIRDLVFAVVGDSYASGEGVPDAHGKSSIVSEIPCDFTELAFKLTANYDGYDPVLSSNPWKKYDLLMEDEPTWMDLSAHRSMQSGHFQSIQTFSDQYFRSAGWTSTLLSFAVSGAETQHLYLESQNFFQREWEQTIVDDQCTNCGQLFELEHAVGKRPIEALLISIGGNDLGFSDVVKTAVTEHLEEDHSQVIVQILEGLPTKYSAINDVIKEHLNVRQVYLVGYPTDLFSRDGGTFAGCGALDPPGGMNLTVRESRLLKSWGEALRDVQEVVAEDLGWVYVSVESDFVDHGYCAEERTYLRSAERSCRIQGDVLGTLHPNEAGHAIYKARILEALQAHARNNIQTTGTRIQRPESQY